MTEGGTSLSSSLLLNSYFSLIFLISFFMASFFAWTARNSSGAFSSYLTAFFSYFWVSSFVDSSFKSLSFLDSYSDRFDKSIILFSFFLSASLFSETSFDFLEIYSSNCLLDWIRLWLTFLTLWTYWPTFWSSVFKSSWVCPLSWVSSFFLLLVFSLTSAIFLRRSAFAWCSAWAFYAAELLALAIFAWTVCFCPLSSAILLVIACLWPKATEWESWMWASFLCSPSSALLAFTKADWCSCCCNCSECFLFYSYCWRRAFSWRIFSISVFCKDCSWDFLYFKCSNKAYFSATALFNWPFSWFSFSSSSCFSLKFFWVSIFSFKAFSTSSFLNVNLLSSSSSSFRFSSSFCSILTTVSSFPL